MTDTGEIKTPQRPRLSTLQAGRAIAALCVLIYHTEITLALPKYYGQQMLPALKALHFGVPYFFALSGFLMLAVHIKDLGKSEKILPFISKRFTRVFPLLWITLFIMLSLAFVSGAAAIPSFFGVLNDILATPLPLQEPLLTVEWTLRHEVLFYSLCAVTIWRPAIGLPLIFAWGLLPLIFRGDQGLLSILVSPYNIIFIFGGLASYLTKYLSATIAGGVLAIGALLFAATWWVEITYALRVFNLASILAYGVASAMLICGAARLEFFDIIKVPGWLNFLGAASYSIYLIHFAAVSVMCKIAVVITTRFHAPLELVFLCVALVSLLVGIAFYLLVEKPMMEFLRRRQRGITSVPA